MPLTDTRSHRRYFKCRSMSQTQQGGAFPWWCRGHQQRCWQALCPDGWCYSDADAGAPCTLGWSTSISSPGSHWMRQCINSIDVPRMTSKQKVISINLGWKGHLRKGLLKLWTFADEPGKVTIWGIPAGHCHCSHSTTGSVSKLYVEQHTKQVLRGAKEARSGLQTHSMTITRRASAQGNWISEDS